MCYNKNNNNCKGDVPMNKKAFTLIELLVTITILGLISFMGFPSLQKMLNQNKTTEFEYYGKSMISAAKIYMQKEGRDLKENTTTRTSLLNGNYIVSVKGDTGLINLGYLNDYKPSKKGQSCIDTADGVKIKWDEETNTTTYKYKLTCHYNGKTYIKSYNDKEFKIIN